MINNVNATNLVIMSHKSKKARQSNGEPSSLFAPYMRRYFN